MTILEQLTTRVIGQLDCACGCLSAADATTLDQVACGEDVILRAFDEAMPVATARRLFDLGFVPGRAITVVRKAPLRDPIVFRVCDYEVALRTAQARLLRVGPAH